MDELEYFDDDDDDAYDDFFFKSIQRYKTLQMFDLENKPYRLLPLNETTICVVGERTRVNTQGSEILKLTLPAKLFLRPEEDGTSKENDFKVVSGIYTENTIHEIDKIMRGEKIITSEENIPGLQIRTFIESSSGKKNDSNLIKVPNWNGTEFAMIEDTSQVICSKCVHKPLTQVDVDTGQIIREIKHPFNSDWHAVSEVDSCVQHNLKCKALDKDRMALLNMHDGALVLHDLKSGTDVTTFPQIDSKHKGEVWTLSGCDFRESSLNYLGILSNKGNFFIYDKRNKGKVVQHTIGTEPLLDNPERLRMKFSDSENKFSVSGLDCLVNVYKIEENNYKIIFTHDGHCPKLLPFNYITDHMWQRTEGREVVISICNNKTLNCWDPKVTD